MPKASDFIISLFNELMTEYPEYKKYLPEITRDIINTALEKVNMKVKSQQISNFIMAIYSHIKK